MLNLFYNGYFYLLLKKIYTQGLKHNSVSAPDIESKVKVQKYKLLMKKVVFSVSVNII